MRCQNALFFKPQIQLLWMMSAWPQWLLKGGYVTLLFSCSVVSDFSFLLNLLLLFFCVSDSLQPHGLQDTRLLCPSLSPGVCSNSCPLSRWCHPTISSSVIPFSSRLQSFPASGSFSMSWLFPSGGLSIGASASALILPENIQGWFPLGLNDLIPSNTTVQKHQFVGAQSSLWSTLTSLQKNHSFD